MFICASAMITAKQRNVFTKLQLLLLSFNTPVDFSSNSTSDFAKKNILCCIFTAQSQIFLF